MKKNWVHVLEYSKKRVERYAKLFYQNDWDNLNEFGKTARFNNTFLRHHKNAERVVFDKEHRLLGVIYLTPHGLDSASLKDFDV